MKSENIKCWDCVNLGNCTRNDGFKYVIKCKNFKPYMTAEAVADLLKINIRTFYRLLKCDYLFMQLQNRLKNEFGIILQQEANENGKNYYLFYKK